MSRAALGQAKAARSEFGDMAITITSTAIISPAILPAQAPDQVEVFRERCEARARLVADGEMSLHEAVDELQNAAEGRCLPDFIGQDRVQRIMADAFAALSTEPVVPEPSRRTPKSTIDAFWLIVSSNDPDRLRAWLRQHPGDVPTLFKLLESK